MKKKNIFFRGSSFQSNLVTKRIEANVSVRKQYNPMGGLPKNSS